ncbi:hypothetical protein [Thermoactinospora rubra]|uniref:hypothetical protein n=1 Tax=Thermoactinospora rubra TaxID=1088767 RepID=UPI000A122034|nr:hypothetical protein [Thermoactinospora rubra]
MLTVACGATQSAAPAPDKPVSVSPAASAQTPAPTPKPVKPVGDAVDTRKVPFTSAKPVSRGKAVKLVWWSGVEPCTVLDRVKVKETAKRVTITLYEGTAPKARDMSCIMLAIEKTYTVKLKKPLGKRKIVDGAKS